MATETGPDYATRLDTGPYARELYGNVTFSINMLIILCEMYFLPLQTESTIVPVRIETTKLIWDIKWSTIDVTSSAGAGRWLEKIEHAATVLREFIDTGYDVIYCAADTHAGLK
ncbi:hypothetical protein CBL_02270 [Carabus blaptoides fortunei]